MKLRSMIKIFPALSTVVFLAVLSVGTIVAAHTSGAVTAMYALRETPRIVRIQLPIKSTNVVSFSEATSDQVIGDPDLLDLMPISATQAYIQGKKIGITNITVFSADRSRSLILQVEVTPDLKSIRGALKRIVPESDVVLETSNGRLIVSGEVPDAETGDRILNVVKSFVGDTSEVTNALVMGASQQVLLEVRFVEATRDAAKTIGTNIASIGRQIGFAGVPDKVRKATTASIGTSEGKIENVDGITSTKTTIDNTTTTANSSSKTTAGYIGDFGMLLRTAGLDAALRSLETKNVVRSLAEPNLVTTSGQEASFRVGGDVPYQTASATGTPSTDFRRYGVALTFTPNVMADRLLRLTIHGEVSEPDTNGGISTRETSTVVELRDSQSLMVAGLLSSKDGRSLDQVPLIGNVPVLGALFRSSSFSNRQTELVIIVTPRLVQPVGPDQPLATPLDKTRFTSDATYLLTGKIETAKPPVNSTPPAGGHILEVK